MRKPARLADNRRRDPIIDTPTPAQVMFDHLTARLSRTIENLRGRGRITDANVAATLREARVALLEADVALPVVKAFIESVRAKALGAEVLASLTPGQAFIGILHTELVRLMGRSEEHTSELQSQSNLVCRLLLEKKK